MVTEQENLVNMKRCPRFEFCSIPKCPLDFYMNERVELSEDERCVLVGKSRSKRVEGNLTTKMRGLQTFIWEKNIK